MRAGHERGGEMITKGIKELCAEAERDIETMTVEQVMAVQDDPHVQLVDIRDIRELWRDGSIPGATHAPRGMLEFWVDPDSPYYREEFGSGSPSPSSNSAFLCCINKSFSSCSFEKSAMERNSASSVVRSIGTS